MTGHFATKRAMVSRAEPFRRDVHGQSKASKVIIDKNIKNDTLGKYAHVSKPRALNWPS